MIGKELDPIEQPFDGDVLATVPGLAVTWWAEVRRQLEGQRLVSSRVFQLFWKLVVCDRLSPRRAHCSRSNFANTIAEMVKVAKLPEPMPMMLVGIPRPGIDVPVYPTGSLALPEPAEGWTAEQLLEEGIERFTRCLKL